MTFSASGATSSVPTGSEAINVDYGQNAWIKIPNDIRVVQVCGRYIGVTPNKEYTLTGWIPFIKHTSDNGDSFLQNVHSGVYWYGTSPQNYPDTMEASFTVYWGPTINAQSPDVTDY